LHHNAESEALSGFFGTFPASEAAMIRHTLNQLSRYNGQLREALSVLDDVDRFRNLHTAFAIFIFAASAVIGIFSFFYLTEAFLWLRLDKIDPTVPAFISYVMLFVIWIFAFLAIRSALEAAGIRNIRSIAQTRLSELKLSSDELDSLREAVAAGHWRHGSIFIALLDGLAEGNSARS
jgi:hypothetical protein